MANALEKLKTSTWPWMTVAVILVAGFMYWLYAQSSSIETATIAADSVSDLPRVADSAFVSNPQRFSGQRVLLSPVTVEELLGRATMLLTVGDSAGYPAILERGVIEEDLGVVAGDNLAVAGWVYALNDSILDVWAQRGLYEQGSREKLTGKGTFFLVDSLDFVFPAEEGTAGSPSS